MSFFLRLALRNLLRNTRRTLLSLVAIIAGVSVLIVGRGFLAGLTENIMRSQIDAVSGHVVVRPDGYGGSGLAHPVDGAFTVGPASAQLLDAEAAAWTSRLLFAPTAIHESDSIRVRAVGFDPTADEAVFPRDAWKLEGTMPEPGSVLISAGVARLLDVQTGEALTLQARTVRGAINAQMFQVSGVLATGNPYFDRFGVLMPLSSADELLSASGAVTHVAVRLDRRDLTRAETVGAAVAASLDRPAEASTWFAETADLRRIQQIRQRALDIIVFALLGISATGIANTVLMAAYERVREIGTLRAMGMTRRGVLDMFLLEGALLGVMGATLGCLFGVAIVSWFSVNGIDLSAVVDKSGGNLPISAMLYLALEPFWVGAAFVFGVLTSIAASFWPARLASRLAPADAVRAV